MKKGWILFLPILAAYSGEILNAIVCYVNGGAMPVRVPGGCPDNMNWNHICMTAQTHLNWLGDWITQNGGIESPGDMLQDIAGELRLPCAIVWAGDLLYSLWKRE